MNKSNYIPGIDGLRCLAIVLVLIFHMDIDGVISSGFTGVDIFFVISGFVITKSLFSLKERSLLSFLGCFYKKRVLRIIPPLVICLLITMLVSTLFIPPVGGLSVNNGITGLSAFGGISNFILNMDLNSYWAPHVEFNPFVHTWSLAIEEQFYLIYPFIIFLYIKSSRSKSPKRYIGGGVLISLMVISLIFNIMEQYSGDLLSSYYLLPSRFWELASGGLLFIVLQRKSKKVDNRVIKTVLSVVGIGLIIISSQFLVQDSYLWASIPVTGTLLLLIVVYDTTGHKTVINKFLELKLLRAIGKISFSLYLWHWPVLVIMRWTVGFETFTHKIIYLFLSFILGLVSYILVENKIKYIQQKLTGNSKKKLLLTVVIISVWIIFFLLSLVIDRNKDVVSLSVTKNSYIWRRWGSGKSSNKPGNSYPHLKGRRLFIVGDSHAAAYRLMAKTTVYDLGIEVVEYERGGYAVGNLLYPMSKLEDQEYYKNLINKLKNEMKKGDILFLASLRMPELSDSFELMDIDKVVDDHFSNASMIDREDALEELSLLIKEFEAFGIDVLIDSPKPVLKTQPYRCSDWFNKNNPIAKPGTDIDKELLLKLREPLMKNLNILKERHPNLYTWDPFFILYENDRVIDKPLFFDGDHLTGHGNRVLIPSFKKKILEIWKE